MGCGIFIGDSGAEGTRDADDGAAQYHVVWQRADQQSVRMSKACDSIDCLDDPTRSTNAETGVSPQVGTCHATARLGTYQSQPGAAVEALTRLGTMGLRGVTEIACRAQRISTCQRRGRVRQQQQGVAVCHGANLPRKGVAHLHNTLLYGHGGSQ